LGRSVEREKRNAPKERTSKNSKKIGLNLKIIRVKKQQRKKMKYIQKERYKI